MHNFLRTSLLALAVSALAGCSLLYDYAQGAALAACLVVVVARAVALLAVAAVLAIGHRSALRQRLQDGKPG